MLCDLSMPSLPNLFLSLLALGMWLAVGVVYITRSHRVAYRYVPLLLAAIAGAVGGVFSTFHCAAGANAMDVAAALLILIYFIWLVRYVKEEHH